MIIPFPAASVYSVFISGGNLYPAFYNLAAGAAAVVIQLVLISFINFAVNFKSAVLRGIILLAFTAASGVILGRMLSPVFLRIVTVFYPGPFLASGFYIVKKYMRRSSFDQLAPGINRIIMILTSYSILLVFLNVYRYIHSPEASFSEGAFGGLYFIPAVLLLVNLRNSSRDSLKILKDKIIFRNEDISGSFNRLQRYILGKFILARDSRVCCSEIVADLCSQDWGPETDCDCKGSCKPSMCRAYISIYRNIASMKKTLEHLGIAGIYSPENKRDIKEEGWKLRLFSGVRLEVEPQLESEPEKLFSLAEKETHNSFPTVNIIQKKSSAVPMWSAGNISVPSVLLAFFNVVFVALELKLFSLNHTAVLFYSAVYFISAVFPFGYPGSSKRMKLFICAGSIYAAMLITLSFFIPEETVLFILIKCLAVYLSVFLLHRGRLRFGDSRDNDKVSRLLFWFLWFYMAALLVFRDVSIRDQFSDSSTMFYQFFYLHDRVIFIVLFLQSVFFLSNPGNWLEINGKEIKFNCNPVDAHLTEQNKKLFRLLIESDSAPVYCSRIAEIMYPEESSACLSLCKPSVCPLYQKMYKRIRVVGRYMENQGIGTVLSPPRKPNSKDEGWRAVLFENVYLKTENN